MKSLIKVLALVSVAAAFGPLAVANDGSSSPVSSYNDHGTLTLADDTIDTRYDNGHRDDFKCWNATGNWQGGASFKSCSFNSGGSVITSRPANTKSE